MREVRDAVRLTLGVAGILLFTGALLGAAVEMAAAAGESDFVGVTPCRVADTRGNGFVDPFGPPALATGVPRDFPLQGQCGLPATATAVSLNVTATSTQGPGFLLLYPQGGAQPLVSTLNYVAGETVANAAIVPLGPGGLTVVAGVSGTDLVLDVGGYFTDSLVHAVDTDNLFAGVGAGNLGTSGTANTAMGARALGHNSIGSRNTAIGTNALLSNIIGDDNTAVGVGALQNNALGTTNTAIGQGALSTSTGGVGNIALGDNAGSQLTAGLFNIDIGHVGIAGDVFTIRLGTAAIQTRAFIAGIRGVTTGSAPAIPVLIDPQGQLGTVSSSRRGKTDIEPVGERSRGLHALRPVSFRYRAHPPDGPVEYGLIAEEVAEVYPELVVRDATGEPETVRYHLLPALLLNELQRHERALADKDRELDAARARVAELAATVAELAARLARLESSPVATGRRADRSAD